MLTVPLQGVASEMEAILDSLSAAMQDLLTLPHIAKLDLAPTQPQALRTRQHHSQSLSQQQQPPQGLGYPNPHGGISRRVAGQRAGNFGSKQRSASQPSCHAVRASERIGGGDSMGGAATSVTLGSGGSSGGGTRLAGEQARRRRQGAPLKRSVERPASAAQLVQAPGPQLSFSRYSQHFAEQMQHSNNKGLISSRG